MVSKEELMKVRVHRGNSLCDGFLGGDSLRMVRGRSECCLSPLSR